ncbi:hypothetical protein [Gemmata sp.]|uniref:hypothetical protein n=1 Tax=Gemmata sp. TaxID=1914242 RepID=UPI003F72DC12
MPNEPSQPIDRSPQPIPVPAEVVESALRDFDEAEVVAAIREIRAGGGRKLEEFIGDLERAARVMPA